MGSYEIDLRDDLEKEVSDGEPATDSLEISYNDVVEIFGRLEFAEE